MANADDARVADCAGPHLAGSNRAPEGVADLTHHGHIRVKRNEDGYRCGDSHQNAKVPDAVVVRARDLHEFENVMAPEIARRLGVEFGLTPPPPESTVKKWIYYVSRNVTPRYDTG